VTGAQQAQVGDGGDLLKRGEPVAGEHAGDPGPEQRLRISERRLGGR
jgi:hypothetical protein